MPVTNKILNASREENCFAITPDRKYYHVDRTFIKRSLRPSEWQVTFRGTIHVPRLGRERLCNEAAALKYIRENTNIPIPALYAYFEDDKAAYLITSYVDGVSMSSLTDTQKAVVVKELEDHIKTLHSLRSDRLGGVSGLVILPYRLMEKTFQEDWNLRRALTADYVFCHNDLSQNNIIVDPATLRIAAIIDWEYAGFFPGEFDAPFYTRIGPSVARNGERDDTAELLKFIQDQKARFPRASKTRLTLQKE